MIKNNHLEDIKEVKEYLEALSELSGNMTKAIVVPDKVAKKNGAAIELITAQAVLIAEHFSILEELLKEINLIKKSSEEEV